MTLNKEALEAAYEALGEDTTGWSISAAIQAYLDAAEVVERTHKRPTAALQNALDERDEARREAADNGKMIAALRKELEQIASEAEENCKRHTEPNIGNFFMAGIAQRIPEILTDTAEAARGYQLVDDEHVVMPTRTIVHAISATRALLRYIGPPLNLPSAHENLP